MLCSNRVELLGVYKNNVNLKKGNFFILKFWNIEKIVITNGNPNTILKFNYKRVIFAKLSTCIQFISI